MSKKDIAKANPKRFTISEAINARKTLRFAAKYSKLAFRQRMRLAKAEKTVTRVFSLN